MPQDNPYQSPAPSSFDEQYTELGEHKIRTSRGGLKLVGFFSTLLAVGVSLPNVIPNWSRDTVAISLFAFGIGCLLKGLR